jgi:hypothetical protein
MPFLTNPLRNGAVFALVVGVLLGLRQITQADDATTLFLPMVVQETYTGVTLSRTFDLGRPIRGMVRNSAEPLFIASSGILLDQDGVVFADFSPLHPEKININHAIYHQAFFLLYYEVERSDGHHLYVDRFIHTDGVVNLSSRRVIFEYQIGGNTTHSGGALAIDDRNYLYISIGDGAPQGDPANLSRDPRLLNGSVIRIDPFTQNGDPPDCGSGAYGVPLENRLNKPAGVCHETLFAGLRHAWRFVLDGENLLVSDVGFGSYEEVNVTARDGYADFGWSCYEGISERYICDSDTTKPPTHYYQHFQDGLPLCAIVGVERLGGSIIIADYCSNTLFALQNSQLTAVFQFGSGNLLPTSFERVGNLFYITTFDGLIIEATTGS